MNLCTVGSLEQVWYHNIGHSLLSVDRTYVESWPSPRRVLADSQRLNGTLHAIFTPYDTKAS